MPDAGCQMPDTGWSAGLRPGAYRAATQPAGPEAGAPSGIRYPVSGIRFWVQVGHFNSPNPPRSPSHPGSGVRHAARPAAVPASDRADRCA